MLNFRAESLITKLPTVNQKEVHKFRKTAHNVTAVFIEKLCERSPLKYMLTRAVSCFSLILIDIIDSKIMEKHFGTFLEILSESGWGSTITTEKAIKEYKTLVNNTNLLKMLKELM